VLVLRLGDLLRSRGNKAGSRDGDEGLAVEENGEEMRVVAVPLEKIDSNPYQPREDFDEEKLRELADSIREHGVLQPVVLRRRESGYELIAGERRVLASKWAGLETIPAIVRDATDEAAAELALIENLQREGLEAVEEALGYARLMREFGLSQSALARKVGRSQSAISNKLRLLQLPEEVLKEVSRHRLSERHARALLKLEEKDLQLRIVQEIVEEELSVRETEKRIDVLCAKAGEEGKGSKRVVRVFKDARLFVNSVKQLAEEMRKSGVVVEMEKEEREDGLDLVIRLRRGDRDGQGAERDR